MAPSTVRMRNGVELCGVISIYLVRGAVQSSAAACSGLRMLCGATLRSHPAREKRRQRLVRRFFSRQPVNPELGFHRVLQQTKRNAWWSIRREPRESMASCKQAAAHLRGAKIGFGRTSGPCIASMDEQTGHRRIRFWETVPWDQVFSVCT